MLVTIEGTVAVDGIAVGKCVCGGHGETIEEAVKDLKCGISVGLDKVTGDIKKCLEARTLDPIAAMIDMAASDLYAEDEEDDEDYGYEDEGDEDEEDDLPDFDGLARALAGMIGLGD